MRAERQDRDLLRRCKTRLAGLEIPDPFDLAAFCEQVGRRVGRTIRLAPFTAEVTRALAGLDVTALWIGGEDQGTLCFRPDALEWHQQFTVLHECAHLLCAHQPVPEDTRPALAAEWVHQVMPHCDPKAVVAVLARHGYSYVQEREAELTASLIEARIKRRTADPHFAELQPVAAEALLRLARALGSGTGEAV